MARILHISPEWKWSKIFILPIIKKQMVDNNCIWLSVPNLVENNDGFNKKLNIVRWNRKYSDIGAYIFSLFFMIRMVRKLKIDKIFAHTSIDSCLYILILRIFTSTKIIYVNHGVPYSGYYGLVKLILKFIEFININLSHEVVTITSSMTKFLEVLNCGKKNINTMVPGTISGITFQYASFEELNQIRKTFRQDRPLQILYVGRIEVRKGIYDLVKAIEKTNLLCELTVLGGTEEQFGLQFNHSKVKFLGFKSDLENYYLNSDILCVPSHHEGFGQVYLEAASFGVVPICCDIPGPTDFIKHGKNGLVVKQNSVESIVEIFDKISNNQFDLAKISMQAFNTAKIYESSKVIQSNMDFFQ